VHTEFWQGILLEKDNWVDQEGDGRISRWIERVGCEDGKWKKLAQDRGRFRALLLSALDMRVLLPGSWLVSMSVSRERSGGVADLKAFAK
jgi:hypothetical protein